MIPPATSGQPPDAYAIWLRTRSAVTSAIYPERISYTIVVSGFDGSVPALDHCRANCDPQDGTVRILPISEEQLARPASAPRGVNSYVAAGLYGAAVVIPVGRPEPKPDLMGVPLLTPTYSFGLRYPSAPRAAFDGVSPLRVIATVSSQAPEYRVELLDEPSIDGTPTYHLRLVPQRRPTENRLRELWIGVNDYLPRRAVLSGNFTVRPLVNVPWTIDFSLLGGVAYIARESTVSTLYLEHRRAVSDAVIAFENIRESAGLYDEPLIAPDQDDNTLLEPPR